MFNPRITPEEFQQTMESARKGVQQLTREKEMANSQLDLDELTAEDVNIHLALFKRLITIVDNVLAVVEDTGDGASQAEEEEDATGFDADIDGGQLIIRG
jgi:Mg2+/Co2+ transporter CorB